MNVLDRYIVSTILKGVAVVLAVLLVIATFIDFVGQLDDVGVAQYDMAAALSYVLLRIPGTVFDMLPAAALVGALLSLGNLAVHRELIVMRASGLSTAQLLGAVGSAGFVLLVVMVLLGESLAPSLGAYARQHRAEAMHEDVDIADGQATWLKDGDRILGLRRQAGELGFGGVLLFDLGPRHDLRQVARADSAEIDAENRWVLANYAATEFHSDGVRVERQRFATQGYNVSPDLLGLSVVREDLLNSAELRRYIGYLQANELDATRYLIAYWARMADTVSVLLMTVLALPFVFGGLRSAGAGARLLVGLLIGLGYYVVAQTFANSGEVFDLDPMVVAWAPTAVLALATAIALARVR